MIMMFVYRYERPIWSKLDDDQLLDEIVILMNGLKAKMNPAQGDELVPSPKTKRHLKRMLLITAYFTSKKGVGKVIDSLARRFADVFVESEGELSWIRIAQDMENRFDAGKSLTQQIGSVVENILQKSSEYAAEEKQKMLDDFWQMVEGRKRKGKRGRKRNREEMEAARSELSDEGAGTKPNEPSLKKQKRG